MKEIIKFSAFIQDSELAALLLSTMKFADGERFAFQPQVFSDLNSAVDFLTYGQSNSRIFIIELNSDTDIYPTIDMIYKDPWLHGTVIIALSGAVSTESMKILLNRGVTDFISKEELKYKLPTVLRIITDNSEIFESQQFVSGYATCKKGRLTVKNDLHLVPDVTLQIMKFCYEAGFRNLDLYSKVSLCLHEIISNAIEHGNCGIGYNKKTEIVQNHIDMYEVVKERANRPENVNKRVHIKYNINSRRAVVFIRDEGEGFDPGSLPNPKEEENIFNVHGRGIMMAKSFSDRLLFSEKGNDVKIVFKNTEEVERKNIDLLDFTKESIISLKTGELLFEDMSESDYFYYILSGKLGVFVNGKQVAESTPEDIFVGEMAFLHHNRRTGTVKALAPTRLLPISRNGFINMIKKYPYAGVFLARLLTKRLAEKNREAT